MKRIKTNREVAKELDARDQDQLIQNSLARIGWIVTYKQKYQLIIKDMVMYDGKIHYLCRGKSRYYSIPEHEFYNYLLGTNNESGRYFLYGSFSPRNTP